MKTQATAGIKNIKRIGLLSAAFLLSVLLGASVPTKQANAAACAAPSETLGSATTTVTIPAEGEYTVWSRIKAPDATNNSYFLQVDDDCYTVGDKADAGVNAWTWVDYQGGEEAEAISITLTEGSHDLKFIGKEAGVALDKVMFIPGDTCAPEGLGTNCEGTTDNAGPAVNMTSPTANQTVTGELTMAAEAADNPGGSSIAKVEFYIGETLVDTDDEAPYTATWDSTTVANGSYVAKAKAFDAAGASADSTHQINVSNGDGGGDNGGGDNGGGDNGGGDNGGGTSDTTNPTVPGDVKAQAAGSNKVNLSWTASTDAGGVAGYKITRNGTDLATVGTTTNYADSTVQPSTTYTYQVIAIDAAGNESEASAAVEVTTAALAAPDTQAPSTPVDLTARAAGSKQINLSWRASTDNAGVAGYEVFRVVGNKDGAGERVATVNATSYGDSGLTPSTAYTYYIVAKDAAGNRSPESARVTATTTAPGTPSGLPSTGPGDDSLGLSGPGGIKGSINLKVSGGRVVVWINGTKRIFSLDSRGNYNVAGLPRGVYSIKYTLRNYRVSFLWLKVDDGVKSQNVSLKQ